MASGIRGRAQAPFFSEVISAGMETAITVVSLTLGLLASIFIAIHFDLFFLSTMILLTASWIFSRTRKISHNTIYLCHFQIPQRAPSRVLIGDPMNNVNNATVTIFNHTHNFFICMVIRPNGMTVFSLLSQLIQFLDISDAKPSGC